MNVLGSIDYKKPIGLANDMRTSTYRGHRYMSDTLLANASSAHAPEEGKYDNQLVTDKAEVSEYADNYVQKQDDPNKLVNPALGGKVEFIKNFEERRLRFIMRPQVPQCSVSRETYKWHKPPVPEAPPRIKMIPAVKSTPLVIERADPGCAKLLDPAATTSRLAYVHYTPDVIMRGIAAHDNITIWNWEEKSANAKQVFPYCDDKMCNEASAKDCPKVHRPHNEVHCVPNRGMTTEVRDNYKPPISPAKPPERKSRDPLLMMPYPQSVQSTENQIYGSGECVQKYV